MFLTYVKYEENKDEQKKARKCPENVGIKVKKKMC